MEEKQTKIREDETSVINDAKSKKKWQKPKLEDVSGKVMAQPYIRFT